jgi:hypothetical protein
MNRFYLACGGAAVGVWLSTVAQSSPSAAYAPHGEPLTCDQVEATQYLSWPQSYGAMKGLLGMPDFQDARYDLYKTPNGYLEVTYLADGQAWAAMGGRCEI